MITTSLTASSLDIQLMSALRASAVMTKRSIAISPPNSAKKAKIDHSTGTHHPIPGDVCFRGQEWPAPHGQLQAARDYLLDIVAKGYRVVIAPDKDADGLTGTWASYVLLIDQLERHYTIPWFI